MKILELGMHFDAAGGGADRYFAGLLNGLESLGEEVAAAAFGEASEPHRIALGPVPLGLPGRLRAAHRLGGLGGLAGLGEPGGKLAGCQLFASHFALYAYPLLGSLRRHRVPHVVHFHGPWAEESAGEGQSFLAVRAKRWLERRVYASADRLIVLSGAFRDILTERYGIARERIAVIPGGVDLDRFRPLCSPMEARERLGWPVDGKVILCVRRLVRRMGLETLLDAFADVSAEHPEARLVIGGRGPLTGELEERARALGIGEKVRLAGFIPDDDLPFAYAAADFTIVPSQALEGFGLITLESLACGTPVLVTPVGGLPEAVAGLEPAMVLEGTSREALAAGLRRGLRPERLAALPSRERCREYAQARFNWSRIAREVLEVYREAAKRE